MAAITQRPWRIAHSEASPGWGGQERRVFAELEGFRRRGSCVALLAHPGAEIFSRARETGLACQPLDVTRWKFPWTICKTTAWLRQFQPQIVNAHSSRDGWTVGIAARLAAVPFVVRTRHFDVPVSNRITSRFVYARLADHVITTSPKVTDDFAKQFGLSEARISTVPTGVDLTVFRPDGAKVSFDLPSVARGLPLVGMVSVLRSGKGHPIFFDAARLLTEKQHSLHFMVVGGGAPRKAMEEMVAAHGAEHIVTLAGHRDDVPAVLRSLDLLVIPSLHEGIPQVGLQALASELPVIGSNVGGIPTIIRPGETGRLFRVGDAAALAEAVREAFSNRAETQRLAKNGRAFVEQNHSLEAMLDQLEALYARHLPLDRHAEPSR